MKEDRLSFNEYSDKCPKRTNDFRCICDTQMGMPSRICKEDVCSSYYTYCKAVDYLRKNFLDRFDKIV